MQPFATCTKDTVTAPDRLALAGRRSEQYLRSKLNEHVILLDTGANRDAVLEAIEAAGGQITHRVSRTAWIINLDRPEADVAKVLPRGSQASA